MEVTLAIGIQAVPERSDHVRWMTGELVRLRTEAALAGFETLPTTIIAMDYDHRGCWWNNRNAWNGAAAFRPAPTHILIMQDDVKFCAGFLKAVHQIIRVRPDQPVGFYMARHAVTVAKEAGVRWLASKNFLSSICTLMPRQMAMDAIDWIAAREAMHPEQAAGWGKDDDVRFNAYFKQRDILVHVTIPNLVEHVGHQAAIGSVLGHYGPLDRRVSRWYIGDDADASLLDWDRKDEVKEWKSK